MSGAARVLKQAQPTVGRQVAALEEELGVLLFDRVGRKLTLTPAGSELLETLHPMAEAAARASLAASGQAQTLEGPVRISASEGYAAFRLPPIVATCRERYPEIFVDILATNDLSDLRRREADIAIRNADPTDPELIARRLPDDHAAMFAATSYLDKRGRPEAPTDLANHDLLGFADNTQLLAGLQSRGYPVDERNFHIGTGASHLVHWAYARAGLGIGLGPLSMGCSDPLMEQVLPEEAPFTFPVWLVAPRELRTSARIRAVFDLLAEGLGGRPKGA